MAIKLADEYPGRANPASADYPYGSIKNETMPDANDGTPLDEKWGNNIEGFLQALLVAGGVAPTGEVEKVGKSQCLDALINVIKAQRAVGEIRVFPSSSPPEGYIKANGALLSRSAYSDLWSYAQSSGNLASSDASWQSGQFSPGDGVSTFRVPDLRGVVIRGWDNSRGLDAGRTIGSYQADNIKSHTHSASSASGGGHTHSASTASAGGHSHAASTSSAGAHTHNIPKVANERVEHDNSLEDDTSVSRTSTQATSSAGAHTHTVTISTAGAHAHTVTVGTNGNHNHAVTVGSTGGAETVMKNVALLACIKY